jgi:hypothetical protein
MACGGCKRRKELAKTLWTRHTKPKQKHDPSGEMTGGIGRKITTTGNISARVRVAGK